MVDKELIRDRIKELEFERSKEINSRQRWLIVSTCLVSVVVVLVIFELQGPKRPFWITFESLAIILVVLTLGFYKLPETKEEKLIKKNYDLLLGRK